MAASSPIAVSTITSASNISGSGAAGVIALLTGVFLILAEQLVDLLPHLVIRDLDVVLGLATFGHEVQEAILGDIKLYLVSICQLLIPFAMASTRTSWYSWRLTCGTSMLWVEGDKSSNFLPVNKSMAVKWTLA